METCDYSKHDTCPMRQICAPSNKCVPLKSSEGKKALDAKDFSMWHRPGRIIKPWNKRPGEKGFNQEAVKRMKDAKLHSNNKNFVINCGKNKDLLAFQKTAKFLCSPSTPINRLLIVHRTGSGKTRTMISILDNFFSDKRPKIVIFPTHSVMINFYTELLKHDNKYREFAFKTANNKFNSEEQRLLLDFAQNRDLTISERKKVAYLRKDFIDMLAMTGDLAHRGERGYLQSPLRALSYTVAGGEQVLKTSGPVNPIFKIGYDGKNAYNNKIVLCDEFHNLVKPSIEVSKYISKIKRLEKSIYNASDSVIVGLTATPIIDDVRDGLNIKNIIKGRDNVDKNDEGFISYFNSLPRSIYPAIIPSDDSIAHIINVPMTVTGDKNDRGNGDVYELLHEKYSRKKLTLPDLHKLQNYCNMGNYYTQHHNMHSKNKFSKTNAHIYASKLAYIADHIYNREEKAIVLMHRAHGIQAFTKVLNSVLSNRCKKDPGDSCWVEMIEKGARASELLSIFNSDNNKRGGLIKALVVDTKEFSEGVSFFGVRRLYIVNPAISWALHKQRLGRVLRACAYDNLDPSERNVTIELYISTHPDIVTADEIVFNKLVEEREELESALVREFEEPAIDRDVLKPFL